MADAEKRLTGKTAIVVGASRGLGRGVAESLLNAGATVVAVARDPSPLEPLVDKMPALHLEAGDATDPVVAGKLLDQYSPNILALVAGTAPLLRPLHHQTWETLSVNWNTDVRMTFHWLREALLLPLPPGSRIVVMSSGAALNGSPLSGGYAGAKATQRFLAEYAAQESHRAGLGISVTAVLPRLTPATELGLPAVKAYAARSGLTEDEYRRQLGAPVTPQIAGAAFVTIASAQPDALSSAYALTGAGPQPL